MRIRASADLYCCSTGAAERSRWLRYLTALAEEFNVLLPTHAGFGLTPRPGWYDAIDDLALTYLELLDRRDLQDVLVIGSSIGGWIASEMAVREHHRISGTVEGIELADFFALTPAELAQHSFHNPSPVP